MTVAAGVETGLVWASLLGRDIKSPISQGLRPLIADRRLALTFACARPAIEADMRVPLILQTISG